MFLLFNTLNACCSLLVGDYFFQLVRLAAGSPLFPYTTLFRSAGGAAPTQQTQTGAPPAPSQRLGPTGTRAGDEATLMRSEEHTSELQSHSDLVCRLLLEKKKKAQDEEATVRLALPPLGPNCER